MEQVPKFDISIVMAKKRTLLYIHAFQIVWREGLVNSNTRGLKMGGKIIWLLDNNLKG